MKTKKIGDLNYKKYKTEIHATDLVIKRLEKDSVSLATLVPSAWFWYDAELFDALDENGDGKPDEKFGYDFKMIYYLKEEDIRDAEKKALMISNTDIKSIPVKYMAIKNG